MKQKGGSSASPAPEPTVPTASEPMPDDGIPDFDESQIAGEPMPPEDAFAGMEGATSVAPGEKPKFEGDWHCAQCGGSITSLPFNPRNTDNLKCLECFKASRA